MGKLKSLIFKPKWQHRDPAVRARAVTYEDDPDLLAALPGIAREDADADVRLAALRRLPDLLPLMRAAADDPEPAVREAAFRHYRALLGGEHPEAPPLSERLEIIPRLEDESLLEYLARSGAEEELRATAVEQLSGPGLLGDLAIAERSRRLRLAIIERIDQPSTLERVAAALRTSDKRAARAAAERLRHLRGQEEETREEDALTLCQALEHLTRSGDPREEKARRLEALEARWQALPEAVRAHHQQRYGGARAIVLDTLRRDAGAGAAPAETPEHKALLIELDAALEESARLDERARIGILDSTLERLRGLAEPAREHGLSARAAALAEAIERLGKLRALALDRLPVAPALLRLAEQAASMAPERLDARRLQQLRERWERAWSERRETPHDADVAARFAAALERLEQALEQREARRSAALERIEGEVATLEAALDAGVLRDAARAQGQVLATLADIGRHPRVDDLDFRARLNAARGRLHELRDWQHWAGNERRQRLLEAAEELRGAGLHPDAVTARLKELRAEWNELDEHERLPGDRPGRRPAAHLFRRFQAACKDAFEPAREFFEKRAEYRAHHLEELEALAAELDAAAGDRSAEPRDLEALVRRGRRALRDLPNIPPAERGPMAQRLRAGADAIDHRLDEHYAVVERRKRRLIDEVAALDPAADLAAAMEAAKDAQRRWKEAGRVRRRRDQELWSEFRAACDAVFAHLEAQRTEEKARKEACFRQLDEILEAARALAAAAAEDPEAAESELRRLRERWREASPPRNRRDRQFEAVLEEVRQAAATARAARALAARRRALDLVALCQAAETRWFGSQVALPELEQQAAELLAQDPPPELAERWRRALGPAPDDLGERQERARDEARELCIAAEFLAGVDSPEEDRQARMDHQVARLSRRMGGETLPRAREELDELLGRWVALAPLPESELEPLQARFRAAFERAQAALAPAA